MSNTVSENIGFSESQIICFKTSRSFSCHGFNNFVAFGNIFMMPSGITYRSLDLNLDQRCFKESSVTKDTVIIRQLEQTVFSEVKIIRPRRVVYHKALQKADVTVHKPEYTMSISYVILVVRSTSLFWVLSRSAPSLSRVSTSRR